MVAASLAASAPASSATIVAPPSDLPDRAIANAPDGLESGDSVAVYPTRGTTLVAARHVVDLSVGPGPCVAHRSTDGGRTWTSLGALPQYSSQPCGVVVVRWAPDGSRLYAATIEKGWAPGEPDTLAVSVSEDQGQSWTGTVVLQSSAEYEALGAPSLAVPLAGGDPRYVYVGLIGRDLDVADQSILLLRSSDGGASWSGPVTVQHTDFPLDGNQLQFPVVSGGPGLTVGVAWSAHVSGAEPAYELRFARSIDGGEHFEQVRLVQRRPQGDFGGAFELAPDLAIGARGQAHVVFTSDMLVEGDDDIFYSWSAPPHASWSTPVKISDAPDGTTQQAPSLSLQKCGTAAVLHVVWSDDRWHTPAPGYARRRDVGYTSKIALPGNGWSPNIRVSNASSPNGPQMNGLATGRSRVFAVWTRFLSSTAYPYYDTNLYGSNIASGITCP